MSYFSVNRIITLVVSFDDVCRLSLLFWNITNTHFIQYRHGDLFTTLDEVNAWHSRLYDFANFTFMLPRIVTDFFLNNQPDALIIQIYSVIKLYMFRASSLLIIRGFLLNIRHWKVSCRFLLTASKRRNKTSYILTLLGSSHQKPAWNLPVPKVQ